MLATLKAEFAKLLTVRSTYFLSLLALFIVGSLAFYNGFHSLGSILTQHGSVMPQPDFIKNFMFGMIQLVTIIASIVAILLLAHEYRYNTINYTLTSSNSRSKVIFAKALVVSVYSVVFTVISIAVAFGLIYLGAAIGGNHVGVQDYHFWQMLGQLLFAAWGSVMFALILATIIRNLVGSIVAVLFIPTVEQILGSIVLKGGNVGYLPFTALTRVTPFEGMPGFSVEKSIMIVLVYVVVFGVVAWYLFRRNDAS